MYDEPVFPPGERQFVVVEVALLAELESYLVVMEFDGCGHGLRVVLNGLEAFLYGLRVANAKPGDG